MWWWTVFLCLLIFYGHTSSQPVTDDNENVRQARQLDFGECCPCPGPGQDFGVQMARARDLDDCPCRARSSDSEGSSSIFFPTSVRSNGNDVRPTDRKEDLKPLLHPEVDLASSVLQTLRDATDEEYQNALARDAARSMAKAAEETIFGDAVPEESNGNIVTIIVNPKHADSLDDVIPQESQVQESCLQVAPKPPSLLREIFRIPRISTSAGFPHKNLSDMDSGMGASNIEEHVVHVGNNQVTNKNIQGLRKYAPLMKFGTNVKDTNMKSDVDNNSSFKKVPDFNLPEMKNKLKDLISNKSALDGKGKINTFPLIPKMRLNNPLLKVKETSNEDLSLLPSNIHEQAKKSFFQTKSHLENILQNTRPVNLKTLLKLKDVEFVPLKDLVPKAVEKPILKRSEFGFPAIFNKGGDVMSTNENKNPITVGKTTEIIEKIPKIGKDETLDAELSPSNVNKQISDDNCNNGDFKTTEIGSKVTENEITSTEGKDKISSLPLIPKMRLNNSWSKVKGKNNEDLSLSPSNIHEQAKKSFLQTKSHLENILKKTRPVNLKPLLKLKDVEFVPLKDLVPKAVENPTLNRSEFGFPAIFNKRGDVISTNEIKNPIIVAKTTEIIEKIPKTGKGETFDAEVSPSNVIEQISEDNCNNGAETDVGVTEETPTANIEITASSPSEIQPTIGVTSKAFANSQSNELAGNTGDCNMPVIETNLSQLNENSFGSEVQHNNEDELSVDIKEGDPSSEYISNDEDCVSNNNDVDSITDSSNIQNKGLRPNDISLENVDDLLENKSTETKEPCSQELPESDTLKNLDINPQIKVIKPLSLDETLSSIKEKIMKQIENLKKTKIISKKSNTFVPHIMENKESPTISDEKVDSDCQNEEAIQVTTVKPDTCNEDIDNKPSETVSMQDLQKISDEMLKEEQERESKILNCSEPTQNIADPKVLIEANNREIESIDPEKSANTKNEVIIDPQNLEITDPNTLINVNSREIESIDSEQSANIKDPQNLEITDPNTPIDINSREIDSEQFANTQNEVKRDPQNMEITYFNIPIDVNSREIESIDSEQSANIRDPQNLEITDLNIPIDVNSREIESIDSEQSANTQNEVIKDPQNLEITDLNILIDVNSREIESIDSEQSAYTQNEVIIDPQNLEITDLSIPIDVNSREIESVDPDQSANTQNKVIRDPQNFVDISNKNDKDIKNTCQSDIILPKQLIEQETDTAVGASEVVLNRTPQDNNVFSSPLLLNINSPKSEIQDLKLAPIPTLEEIKLRLAKLFDKPARNVEEHSASEAASKTDTSNILTPIMSTDASTLFQSRLPSLGLEDLNLDILQLEPHSNLFSKIPKIDLHSFKTKLPLPNDLRIKPIKLQSLLEDKGNLLGATLTLGRNNPWEIIPNLDDFGTRMKANTQKITKTLRKPDTLRNSLKSSQRIGDLPDTKNALKSMQHSLESKFRGATRKPVNFQTNDLLEAISRNHEDVNDKLKALHIDFNDRIETMRNNLFDKSIFGSGESRSMPSFSAFNNKNKDKKLTLKTAQPQSLSSRRESKKTLKSRRLEQPRDTRIGSSHGLQNKFKMPTAASVPVPRTVEVPELKTMLTKPPGLAIQRASGANPNIQNKEASQAKETSIALWKQASKKLPITNTRLGKPLNPFKDSKIKVSFSTTPRPILPTRLPPRKLPASVLTSNLGKNTETFGKKEDHNGSPSEMKHSIISPPFSSHEDQQNLKKSAMESESRQTGVSYDGAPWKLIRRENLKQSTMSKDLQSWPKVSESAFLSKVKEAVKARLSKVNSPSTFKRSDAQSVSISQGEKEVLNPNTDMARSASENTDFIERQALKENVSYKCTMVCTKE